MDYWTNGQLFTNEWTIGLVDNYSLMNGLLDYWITTGIMKVNEETN